MMLGSCNSNQILEITKFPFHVFTLVLGVMIAQWLKFLPIDPIVNGLNPPLARLSLKLSYKDFFKFNRIQQNLTV